MRLLPGFLFAIWLAGGVLLAGQKRILQVTHSAGFRHDSIRTSIVALQQIGERTGRFQVTATEDLSYLTAERLRDFDAIFFFTSGELALSDGQKRDLLEFVRGGKGFGGAHSATDTLYLWPEYGEMIGGYFDGHPWVKEVSIDVEEPEFPGMKDVAPSFRIVDEIYQFRAFSRERVRVLTTLDTGTVDLNAVGVNRSDGDFALSWVRPYGAGRVFYTALGHFDETWLNPVFQKQLEGALLWLIGDVEADAAPRVGGGKPVVTSVGTSAGPADNFAPGSMIVFYGERLTTGSVVAAPLDQPRVRLAGTRVELDEAPLDLFAVTPAQVQARLPWTLSAGERPRLRVVRMDGVSDPVDLTIVDSAPVVAGAYRDGARAVLQVTGIGRWQGPPMVEVNGAAAEALEWRPIVPGLWRLEIAAPAPGASVRVRAGPVASNVCVVE